MGFMGEDNKFGFEELEVWQKVIDFADFMKRLC